MNGHFPIANTPSGLDADTIKLVRASRSENTILAYGNAFSAFCDWCDEKGLDSLPASPEVVATYLAHRAKNGLKASSLAIVVSAIRYCHAGAGLPSPTDHQGVKDTMRGIRRTYGTAQTQKAPATVEAISAMLSGLGNDMKAARDRALLSLGMAGAFRRSELVSLDIEDLTFTENGLDVLLRRSKTDQEAQGATVAIPTGSNLKPVDAVKAWLVKSRIESGPLFRATLKNGVVSENRLTGRSVANIIKGHAERAGLDAKAFSGHSLRAGFITSASDRQADLNRIMDQSRHTDPRTVRKYIRHADRYRNHAGASFL